MSCSVVRASARPARAIPHACAPGRRAAGAFRRRAQHARRPGPDRPAPAVRAAAAARQAASSIMGGTGVIDHFLEVFTRYIDSGFGLLGGEVAFVATTLIVIDVTLAALFWSWGADDDILARLVKKTLFVGVFAYLIGNWNNLARIVFESFAGLGLKASGTGFTTADLLRPGRVAQTGLDAGRPLLDSISGLMGYWSFFENFIQIACLFLAWALVLLAFFILAVQLFVTLIEFKLTTLAGFVLIPFGLFGQSAFMAERVLGNVISSGIRVLVLAVIIGIGSTLFSEFTAGFGGASPTIDQAMAIVLAALSLLGLGIFGPGIANGLVSGGPQLSAGAAVGTGLAASGAAVAAVRPPDSLCAAPRRHLWDRRGSARRRGARGRRGNGLQPGGSRTIRHGRRCLRPRRRRARGGKRGRLAAPPRGLARGRQHALQLRPRRSVRFRGDRRRLDDGHDRRRGVRRVRSFRV